MKPFQEADRPDKEIMPKELCADEIFVNDTHQVNVRHLPEGWTWLSIKRKDKSAIHDWRELQQIKNLMCGAEREAVELYPAESRLVDTSNQFHLFVMPADMKFPFGYGKRLIVEDSLVQSENIKSKQRPWAPEDRPADCISAEEAKKMLENYGKD